MNHFSISQASIVTLLTQVVSFVVGFGIINNGEAGAIIAAATAVVNVGFLIANSVHAFAHAAVTSSPALAPVPVAVVPPV